MSHEWEREAHVTCVVCPHCAFTFDALHENDTPERGYSCPACAEIRLRAALTEIVDAMGPNNTGWFAYTASGIASDALTSTTGELGSLPVPVSGSTTVLGETQP